MSRAALGAMLTLAGVTLLTSGLASAGDLTFEDRLEAARAIERVYYGHQIGASRPFDETVPDTLLVAKVRESLKQSSALERFWSTPMTGQALVAELSRIARETRFPDRLLEVYAALHNDPFLIQECFARPVITDRLAREFFAMDSRFHAAARSEAVRLREQLLAGTFAVSTPYPSRSVEEIEESGTGRAQRVGEIGPIIESRDAFLIRVPLSRKAGRARVATYRIPKKTWDAWWNEVQASLDEGAARALASESVTLPLPMGTGAGTLLSAGPYPKLSMAGAEASTGCAPDNTWDNAKLDDFLDGRSLHTAVWTGSLMLVWGGFQSSTSNNFNTGGRYDPLTDSWTQMSTQNAPQARRGHLAVWSGTEMIVWGGIAHETSFDPILNTGGRYNPVTDSWTATSTVNAPEPRYSNAYVWTGTELIIWGGSTGLGYVNTGGRYNPSADTWAATSLANAPSERRSPTAVWSGSRMIIWGGHFSDLSTNYYLNTGGLYDPGTNTWSAISTDGAPIGRVDHSAVWAGSRMVVWGGNGGDFTNYLNTGGRYDPATNTWMPTATNGAPSGRYEHKVAWTGDRMIVWGGADPYLTPTGGLYDPVSDAWTPTSTVNAPQPRYYGTGVWSGDYFLIWGGQGTDWFNDGGRYDPIHDSWTPISVEDQTGRTGQTVIWTGNRMIIWGGDVPGTISNTGSRYDPLTDSWTATSTVGAPQARREHTAIWTGNLMIVWGGSSPYLNTGGRYNPIADSWTPTSLVNAPGPRGGHTAVWTGSKMIVWGGFVQPGGAQLTGGRYDPVTDTWAATSLLNPAEKRIEHTAVWTGSRMVIWGGRRADTYLDTGGRYDPVADSWSFTSKTTAPAPRRLHTAIWTGSRMVVWGGSDATSFFNSGGQYDPVSDSWQGISTTGAPAGRDSHRAIWSGSLMAVWGGEIGYLSFVGTGGRYNPSTNTWSPISSTLAPSPRYQHTAVWTGDAMVVWGGQDPTHTYAQSGGRYAIGNPDTDMDGVADGCDCAPANGGAFSIPGEVQRVRFGADETTLTWRSAASGAGSGTVHDVLRGVLTELPVGPPGPSETCLAPGVDATSATDAATPAPGAGFYYLIRGRNVCGAGTYGFTSGGAPRVSGVCP